MGKETQAGGREEWLDRYRALAPEITDEQRAVAVRVLTRAGRQPGPITSPEAQVTATPGRASRGRSGTQSAA